MFVLNGFHQGNIDFPKGIRECAKLCKRTKFKQGLKIESLTLLLRRTPAVMYRSDSTRLAKYSTSCFHVESAVYSRTMRGACSVLPYGESIQPRFHCILIIYFLGTFTVYYTYFIFTSLDKFRQCMVGHPDNV